MLMRCCENLNLWLHQLVYSKIGFAIVILVTVTEPMTVTREDLLYCMLRKAGR